MKVLGAAEAGKNSKLRGPCLTLNKSNCRLTCAQIDHERRKASYHLVKDVSSSCTTKTCYTQLKNWYCEIKWLNPYLVEVLKKNSSHNLFSVRTQVSSISFLYLIIFFSKEGCLNYMTGPIVKLEWVAEVKSEFRGSSFQTVDHTAKLYHQTKS